MRQAGELLKQFDAKGKRTDTPGGGGPTKSRWEVADAAGMSKDRETQAVRFAIVLPVLWMTTRH
jgi:hypothetical protein